METFFRDIIERYEKEVHAANSVRNSQFGKLNVVLLRQQALLIRRKELENIYLAATTDFDAQRQGEPPLDDIFKKVLGEAGLTYDEDSKYIWLPDETKYEQLYSSPLLEIKSPTPLYLIVSKAVKAPAKNRPLVVDAIVEYGDSLLELLEKYDVDLDYFV